MKFLDKHRNDIIKRLETVGLSKDLFSFRKKNGRIIIDHNGSDSFWFSFFHKEDFSINPITMKRVDEGYWEVKTSSTEVMTVDNWEKVIKQLNNWLRRLK